MKVETYEVEEVSGEMGVMAADAESAELIEKMGLGGQKTLLNPETCTRFQYRKMTKIEHKVFSLLFPQRERLIDFKDGIIPLRVLQVASWVGENAPADMQAGIYVWHCGSAKEDPLLVGHTSAYGGEFYLLARWGDALLSFEEMIVKAKEAWKAKAKAKASKEIAGWNSDAAAVDDIATELFSTGGITCANNNYSFESL